MKEIKFRAWGKYGSEDTDCMVENWQDSDLIEYTGFDGGGFFTLMYYTGLKDKNDKEIYEGDILDGDPYVGKVVIKFGGHGTSTDYYADVAWGFYGDRNDGTDSTYSLNHCLHSNQSEVIGNIHENPTLVDNVRESK